MKERPILFSAPMVRAILEGRKTQTRRVVRLTDAGRVALAGRNWHVDDTNAVEACPYGAPGDRLWVRETCWVNRDTKRFAWYVHQDVVSVDPARDNVMKRPAIHMPRADSRILLEITDVRVQRLQDIAREDAAAEGVCLNLDGPLPDWCRRDRWPEENFAALWDSLNAARGYGWNANPWVWAVSFKRADA